VTSLIIDEIQVADTPQSATWYLCFDATVRGVNRRYYIVSGKRRTPSRRHGELGKVTVDANTHKDETGAL
jgi:hypothetical protein